MCGATLAECRNFNVLGNSMFGNLNMLRRRVFWIPDDFSCPIGRNAKAAHPAPRGRAGDAAQSCRFDDMLASCVERAFDLMPFCEPRAIAKVLPMKRRSY